MDTEQKKATFLGLTKDSITTILAAVFMVGVAWTKLNDVETSIKAIADQVSEVNKAQVEYQIKEQLLEARVLNLETSHQSKSK